MLARIVVESPRTWKDKEGQVRTESDFVPCLLKGRDAENAEVYLKKGSAVLVEGRLTTRTFEDRQGNRKSVTEVLAGKVVYLGAMKDAAETMQR